MSYSTDELARELLEEKAYPYWVDPHLYHYIDIPRGWFRLVSDLIDVLVNLDRDPLDPRMRLLHIKEMPGGYLSVSADHLNADQAELIRAACDLSSTICVHCGKPGDLSRVSAEDELAVLCPDHLALAIMAAARRLPAPAAS